MTKLARTAPSQGVTRFTPDAPESHFDYRLLGNPHSGRRSRCGTDSRSRAVLTAVAAWNEEGWVVERRESAAGTPPYRPASTDKEVPLTIGPDGAALTENDASDIIDRDPGSRGDLVRPILTG